MDDYFGSYAVVAALALVGVVLVAGAFLYVVFAVDAVFLFPGATIFAAPGYGPTTLVETGVFLAVLAAALAYAWKKGVLTWV